MTWKSEPDADDVSKWFAGVKLHGDLEHDKYVGGIVAIEDKQTKQWNAYPKVSARIAYFWDWCDEYGFYGEIDTTDPSLDTTLMTA